MKRKMPSQGLASVSLTEPHYTELIHNIHVRLHYDRTQQWSA